MALSGQVTSLADSHKQRLVRALSVHAHPALLQATFGGAQSRQLRQTASLHSRSNIIRS